jgi:hypothetical protein
MATIMKGRKNYSSRSSLGAKAFFALALVGSFLTLEK